MGNCGSGKDYNKKRKDRSKLYEQAPSPNPPQQGGPAKGTMPGSNSSFNPVKYDHVIANQGNVE